MGAERWDEQVGSVADEATRLLESLRRTAKSAAESAESAVDRSEGDDGPDAAASGPASGPPGTGSADGLPGGGAADGMPGGGAAPDPGAAPHDPFCTWCPLCRGAAVVRSLSPETLTRLADLAGLAATVLADLASARTSAAPPASDGHPAADAHPTTRTTARPAARPRRATPAPSAPITVRDADDPQEAPRG